MKHRVAQTPPKFFLRVLLSLLLFFLAVAGVNRLLRSDIWPIQQVQVRGEYTHVSSQSIEAIVKPLIKDKGFFSVKVSDIRRQLVAKLPWIKSAVVSRRWQPSGLKIVLSEYKPIAIWNNIDLLTASGVSFSPSLKTFPKDLPVLLGSKEEQSLMLSYLKEIDQELTPLNLRLTEIQLNQDLQWQLHLSNGILLSLGQDKVLAKIHQFVKIYPKIIGGHGKEVAYVNMQYNDGLALKWKPGVRH